jgi:hypothetical protein
MDFQHARNHLAEYSRIVAATHYHQRRRGLG